MLDLPMSSTNCSELVDAVQSPAAPTSAVKTTTVFVVVFVVVSVVVFRRRFRRHRCRPRCRRRLRRRFHCRRCRRCQCRHCCRCWRRCRRRGAGMSSPLQRLASKKSRTETRVTTRSKSLPVVDGPSIEKRFNDRCVKDGDVEVLRYSLDLDGRLP